MSLIAIAIAAPWIWFAAAWGLLHRAVSVAKHDLLDRFDHFHVAVTFAAAPLIALLTAWYAFFDSVVMPAYAWLVARFSKSAR